MQSYAFAKGAQRIIAVSELEAAYALKRAHPDYVLMGERGLKKPDGFDFGNSPSEIEGLNFSGRTFVHTTSHGTQGMGAVTGADDVIVAAFVNAAAVVTYIRLQSVPLVSFVCMGNDHDVQAAEDTALAEYLIDFLPGKQPDFNEVRERLRSSPNGARFLSEQVDYAPARDFDLCLSLDCFDFIIRAESVEEGSLILSRI